MQTLCMLQETGNVLCSHQEACITRAITLDFKASTQLFVGIGIDCCNPDDPLQGLRRLLPLRYQVLRIVRAYDLHHIGVSRLASELVVSGTDWAHATCVLTLQCPHLHRAAEQLSIMGNPTGR